MPRVVAGTCRGIPLAAPKGENTRPTTDKVKEALFSILQNRLPDASFLDLFAGCGQMGIEAVSRGAREAVLVDENNRSADAISQNIAKTKMNDKIRYIKKDVFRTILNLAEHKETFDIIYMDPPYASAIAFSEKIAGLICSGKLLRENGLFIVEHSSSDLLEENVMNLTFTRRCKYGSTMLTFYTTDDCY
jgi:16S rRNA (guanine966-N2)-methyltransferase